MTVTIRQLHPHFFGEVSGVDLRKPLTAQEAADIEAGMDRYAVLVFRDQNITDEQQITFSKNFGAIENSRGGHVTKPADMRLQTGMNDVSNLGKDGKPLARDSRQRLFNLGNLLWHSDSSFRAIPAKYSLLSARTVNRKGGNTEFADMRAAYDALDDDLKAEVQDLICEHSLMYSRGSLGFVEYSEEERQLFAPVRQLLVRTHPVTGRKSLYLSSHAGTTSGRPNQRRAFCCAISMSTRRNRASCTCTNGSCTISSCGITGKPCIAGAGLTRHSRVMCGARRWPAPSRRCSSRRRSRIANAVGRAKRSVRTIQEAICW